MLLFGEIRKSSSFQPKWVNIISINLFDTFRQRKFRNAVSRSCSAKKMFIAILQNSLENTYRSLRPATLLTKRLRLRYFRVIFAKFLKTPFFL